MSNKALTALDISMMNCHCCGFLSKGSRNTVHPEHCQRCGAAMHFRKPDSIARTWAFLIAACIMYIPANVLPIMTVTSLGHTEADTIMSGVVYFIVSGSWPLALIIFTASVFVPVLKLVLLTFLLISVQINSNWRPKERTRLYRVTEAVGRWSMVDIYVVTLMVALVKIQGLADIEAGPGAVAFASVVVLTMFSAMSFDPRLIWDHAQEQQ